MQPYVFLGFFFMVVGLPILAGIYFRHIRFKEKQLEVMGAQTAEKAAQYAAHTERLEERVRVLERIATDRGVDLATEIDSLRDQTH
jgi:hypothetical protein